MPHVAFRSKQRSATYMSHAVCERLVHQEREVSNELVYDVRFWRVERLVGMAHVLRAVERGEGECVEERARVKQTADWSNAKLSGRAAEDFVHVRELRDTRRRLRSEGGEHVFEPRVVLRTRQVLTFLLDCLKHVAPARVFFSSILDMRNRAFMFVLRTPHSDGKLGRRSSDVRPPLRVRVISVSWVVFLQVGTVSEQPRWVDVCD
mmetsp:Transcript_1985/g.4469  ORF Transcript_1985/g.4469 Transcript_1985/m.4469 type:complete len:206 (+) Transcript_1985:500-1117(+)